MFTTMSAQLSTLSPNQFARHLAHTAPQPDQAKEGAVHHPDRTETVKKADFDGGWDLPERRKFRYRLEDVAY
jgi:hypothetical protein